MWFGFFFPKYFDITIPETFLDQPIVLFVLISARFLSLVLLILTNTSSWRSQNNFAAKSRFPHTVDLEYSGMSCTWKSVQLNGKWIITMHHIPAQRVILQGPYSDSYSRNKEHFLLWQTFQVFWCPLESKVLPKVI